MKSTTIKSPGVNDKAIYEVIKRLKVKGEIVLALVKEDGTLDRDSTVTLKVTSGLASDIPLRTRYTLSSQNVSTYKLFQASAKPKVSAKDKPAAVQILDRPALAKSTPVEIPDNATPAKPVPTKCVATLGSTTTQNAKTKSTTKTKVAVKAKPVTKTKPAAKAKAKAPAKAKKVTETK